MKNSDEYLYRRQEYTQSANSLFHFMQERKFLLTSLKKKALFPRYCEEQIDYLNLQDSEMVFPKIAVLEKCFCDISLHNIGKEFDTELDLNSSKDLDEEIKEKGLIVSEIEPGKAPMPYMFPRRNRIVSGLSQAVVVAEAGTGSGALITAELAASHGREVFDVPGNIISF